MDSITSSIMTGPFPSPVIFDDIWKKESEDAEIRLDLINAGIPMGTNEEITTGGW